MKAWYERIARKIPGGGFLFDRLMTMCEADRANVESAKRLRSIDVQLKAQNRLKDSILTFYYRDTPVEFFLPLAPIDGIQTEILDRNTFYEIEELELVKTYIPPNAIVADVGANIGNHTVFFSKFCGAKKVYAFEPQRKCGEILKKNTELNGVHEIVAFYPVALSDVAGQMSILTAQLNHAGATSFVHDNNGEFRAVTMDELDIPLLDFLKIDVEGAQLEMLKGARKTLERCSPTIWIELNCDTGGFAEYDYQHEVVMPREFLRELGYELVMQTSACNYLFKKKKLMS